jgi:hypothetical protein
MEDGSCAIVTIERSHSDACQKYCYNRVCQFISQSIDRLHPLTEETVIEKSPFSPESKYRAMVSIMQYQILSGFRNNIHQCTRKVNSPFLKSTWETFVVQFISASQVCVNIMLRHIDGQYIWTMRCDNDEMYGKTVKYRNDFLSYIVLTMLKKIKESNFSATEALEKFMDDTRFNVDFYQKLTPTDLQLSVESIHSQAEVHNRCMRIVTGEPERLGLEQLTSYVVLMYAVFVDEQKWQDSTKNEKFNLAAAYSHWKHVTFGIRYIVAYSQEFESLYLLITSSDECEYKIMHLWDDHTIYDAVREFLTRNDKITGKQSDKSRCK